MKKTKMLKKNYEFKNVLSKGKNYSGKQIKAFIIKNNKKNLNLLGIAISTKVANAVKRNKIKRLIREVYKKKECSLEMSYTIIFLFKKSVKIEEVTYRQIEKDMEYIFEKAKIFIKEKQ